VDEEKIGYGTSTQLHLQAYKKRSGTVRSTFFLNPKRNDMFVVDIVRKLYLRM
jgi:hypothetical protein